MRKILIIALLLTLLAFLLPLLIPGGRQAEEEAPPEKIGDWSTLDAGGTLRVLLDGEVTEMPLNEYIWGVVAAEMPASFEMEALKAQSVAARTYVLSRMDRESSKHPGADICGDHRCCQAYISPEQAAENWGAQAAAYQEKIRKAVAETGTEGIYYEGALIDAVFHSSAGEMTVDAVEVWGSSRPYLQPVESPEGDEVPNYHSSVTISAATFKESLLAAHPEASLEGSPAAWFGEVFRSEAGSVQRMMIGGIELRGVEVRSLYKLRSTAFTVRTSGEEIIFDVVGYGHGVGMSQYGANAMAKEGKSYREILSWYYTGVEIR